jgi:hypothetical protein
MKRGRQGKIFRIRLGDRWLTLWLLGILPVGWVRLDRIDGIEQREIREFWRPGIKRLFQAWRYWLWPSSPGRVMPRPGTFVVRTASGAQIWMRLRSGLHYQLREAVHRNRTGLE